MSVQVLSCIACAVRGKDFSETFPLALQLLSFAQQNRAYVLCTVGDVYCRRANVRLTERHAN